jgi:hypothetical protein
VIHNTCFIQQLTISAKKINYRKKQEEEVKHSTKDYLTEESTLIKHRQASHQLTIAIIAGSTISTRLREKQMKKEKQR